MKQRVVLLVLLFAIIGRSLGQEAVPTATPRGRSWLGRMLHPFSSEPIPQYKDPRLRGLAVGLKITPEAVKLSEGRPLGIKVTVKKRSKHPRTLAFPTNQRHAIYFTNSPPNNL